MTPYIMVTCHEKDQQEGGNRRGTAHHAVAGSALRSFVILRFHKTSCLVHLRHQEVNIVYNCDQLVAWASGLPTLTKRKLWVGFVQLQLCPVSLLHNMLVSTVATGIS